jgi:large subunit ribosomal protein L6
VTAKAESFYVTFGKERIVSRVGNEPIPVPDGVDTKIEGSSVTVKGPKGTLSQTFSQDMTISRENGVVKVQRPSDEREHRALHGLTRSLLANMVLGVSQGFSKSLELVGVGYRVQQSGQGVTLSVMLSHQVDVQPPEGITLEVEGTNRINVSGIDKQAVGQIAAEIRSVRPPNPYTGKGIRYAGEFVRIKPGKSARRVE